MDIEVLCKDFPFVRKYLKNELGFTVYVHPVNESIFYEKRETEPTNGFGGWPTTNVSKRIFFLDEEGNEIYEVGTGFHWWNPFTWKKFPFIQDTVGETLVRLGEKGKKVRYIILKERNLSEWRHHLTLFTSPEDFTIRECIKD